MKNLMLISSLALLLAACAHHRDVRAGADGVHRVVVITDDKEEGSQDAINQANHFCQERNLAAAFLTEEQKYTGEMAEKDYQKVKTAGNVAKAVGGTVWALGGSKESNIGGVVGLAGVGADVAAGKGYTIEMKFKCQ